jgi:hypothetical protein
VPATTAAPLGMGVALLNFLPGRMTFEEYFGFEGQADVLQRSYLVERSQVNLANKRGPSTVIACQLCAGVAAAEALKILLARGPVLAAPCDSRSRPLGPERRQRPALALRDRLAGPPGGPRLRHAQPLRLRPQRPVEPDRDRRSARVHPHRGERLEAAITHRRDLSDTRPTFDVHLTASAASASPLLECLRTRSVQRRALSTRALSQREKAALEASVGPGYRIHWLEGYEGRWRAARREHVLSTKLSNVELRLGDISRLPGLEDQSVVAVISTMALHHLPTFEHLRSTFLEIWRILKPGGGVYLVDFGHLKSERLYSLRAAFSLADCEVAGESLRPAARLYSTFLAPYMVAFKSAPRREPDAQLRQAVGRLRAALPAHHKADLRDLATFFGLGGMRSRLL